MNDTEKKSSSHAMIIGILLTVVAVLLLALGVALKYKNAKIVSNASPANTYEKIMSYDFTVKYPENYYDVMKAYDLITSYLYSKDIKDDEVPHVVEQQRHLFATEMLESNSYDTQVASVREELKNMTTSKQYVTSVINDNIVIDQTNNIYAKCNVIQYITNGVNRYGEYTLVQQGKEWKIYSWKFTGRVEKIDKTKK